MRLGLIGGTGIDELTEFRSGEAVSVETRFGAAEVIACEIAGAQVMFVPRHGIDHSVPPSLVNYRAQIAALKKLGVDRVIGICAVGSLRRDLTPGMLAVLTDFIDLTKRRNDTFFDEPAGPVVHTDLTHPYCPEVSAALQQACSVVGALYEPSAVYVGVEGPRYETPAEIKLYASWGAHVIGMTCVPEVALAREAGLCYGALAIVTNLACGLSPTPLAHDEVRAAVHSAADRTHEVLRAAIGCLPETASCACSTNTQLSL